MTGCAQYQKGLEAVRNGERSEAAAYFREAAYGESATWQAWLWLQWTTDSPSEAAECVDQARLLCGDDPLVQAAVSVLVGMRELNRQVPQLQWMAPFWSESHSASHQQNDFEALESYAVAPHSDDWDVSEPQVAADSFSTVIAEPYDGETFSDSDQDGCELQDHTSDWQACQQDSLGGELFSSFLGVPHVEETSVESSWSDASVADDVCADGVCTEETNAEESIIEESIVEESIVEESIVEESIAEESIAEESIADESFADESFGDESFADESFGEHLDMAVSPESSDDYAVAIDPVDVTTPDTEDLISREVSELREEVASHLSERDEAEAGSTDFATPSLQTSTPATSPTILVVDDSPTVRKLVTMTLESGGYAVRQAENGIDAMKVLAESTPALILLDVNMPRMDGYQLCKLIKRHDKTKRIPVVMLSGKDGMFDKLRGKLVGCNDYMSKPFEATDLLRRVQSYLGVFA